MSLDQFIQDVKNPEKHLKKHFNNADKLISALVELNDVIGMRKVKSQIVKQIKTFISAKVKGTYNQKDRKHCLLCGPPGCGKTTVGKILCKIWIAMGFLGENKKTNSKSESFNKLQDEIIRKQRMEIKEYKDKVRGSLQCLQNIGRINTLCKRTLNNSITIKNSSNVPLADDIIRDVSGMAKILEESTTTVEKLNRPVQQDYRGMGIENDPNLQSTKESTDLPFYVYNRNDVVSRYVGDTSHRCTKAMTDALYGVVYFDEAYNLCNDSNGLGDQYGKDALTIINQFMDEQSDKLIVVFAGYKKDIYNNLFRAQQGLESRFTNKFEIENYNYKELTQIYIQRLSKSDWIIDNTFELNELIKENFDLFKYQGRDMDTLAIYTKDVISESIYEDIIDGKKFSNKITSVDYVEKAIQIFKDNMLRTKEEEQETPDFRRIAEMLRA